ncbi:MAG: ATP-binding protein [Candidatus Diapherotrites archaeon]
MDSAQLDKLLEKWKLKGSTFARDIESDVLRYVSNRHVVYLYGPRQAGKSTLARRILDQLPSKTTRRYVNLEDPSLVGELNVSLLDDVVFGLSAKDTIVLDEIQLIDGWEKWVRRAVDTRQCQVIVTGSSAKLLSGEFATSLGGRGIGFQVLPLSFKEYQRVTGRKLDDYLRAGGYPEVTLHPDEKQKLFQSYFELALVKDIASRYNIRDITGLRNFAYYLLTNTGKETSLKQLRSFTGLSYDTIRQYLDALETSFLVFQVPFFAYSMKQSLTRPRKVYAYDLGMQQYATKSFTPDTGRLAENAVAIECKRRNHDLYYWKGKHEVDLVMKEGEAVRAVNVCWEKTPPARENESLKEFSTEFKKAKTTLLCGEKEIFDWLLKT